MRVGPYEVQEELGRGGMGVVFRARAPDGRDFAVKVLLRPEAKTARDRFERERRLLDSLGDEAGFVPLTEVGASERGPYLVMPLLEGGTLRDRLRNGPLGIEASIKLGKTLARALGRAHAAGVVHRDLKPENVLYTRGGRPLVADLGLAKHFREDAPGASQSVSLSVGGELRGTAGYMAPEQLRDAKTVGPPADVFSLGAIIYECLAGRCAFDGGSVHEVFAKVARGEVVPLRKAQPEVPRWLDEVVTKALATDVRKRYEDGEALARALEAGRGTSRERRLVPYALAIVLVLSAIAGALALERSTQDPTPTATATSRPSDRAQKRSPSPEARAAQPDWYAKLPASARPRLPLPRNLAFSKTPGEYENAKDGSVLVYVPAGAFLMGADYLTDYERPVHEVELSGYFVGKLELANGKFETFVRATGYVTESEKDRLETTWRNPVGDGKAPVPDHPVVRVTWADARAYCVWAGLRFPTEAEWEKAARWDPVVKRARRFPWGDMIPGPGTPLFANLPDESLRKLEPEHQIFTGYDDGHAGTAPVGSFPAGASAYGALDMTGNVAEWCEDEYIQGFYETGPRKDPVSTPVDKRNRIYRGGGFSDLDQYAASRNFAEPTITQPWLGFRVACSE